MARVLHHVDLGCAQRNRSLGLVRLDLRHRRAKREANHRAHLNRAAAQQIGTKRYPRWVDADRGKAVSPRLGAQRDDLIVRCIRLKQRVVDHSRQVGGHVARSEPSAESGRAGSDHIAAAIGTGSGAVAVATLTAA